MNIFDKYNIKLNEKAINDFDLFCNFLREQNKKFNLTAIKDKDEIYDKHFVDSLCGQPFFDCGKVAEIGSGGGFPSVPLKIANPNLNFTLIEATKKKCDYLNDLKNLLKFDNFTVINDRCEQVCKSQLRGTFDIVTARAVAKLNVLCELCIPLLTVGGKAIFYKLFNQEETDEAKNCIKILGCEIEQIKRYNIFTSDKEREIIIIRKVKKTPDLYPREYKKIIKSPL